jgi:hypothetical protein
VKRFVLPIGILAAGLCFAAPAVVPAQLAPLPGQTKQSLDPPEDEDRPALTVEPERGRTKAAPPPQIKRPPVNLPGNVPAGKIQPLPQLPPQPPPSVLKPVRPPSPQAVVPPPRPPRRPPELHPSWPITRPPREAIERRRRERDRIPPAIFLPPLIFPGIIVDDWRRGYERDRLTWADSETLYRDDEWVEFVLDCNAYGRKLWFEVRDGRVRIDWAEIVFDNGETQVVDFSERSIGPGLYVLLDFPGGRRVDHVRMVAQAASRQVRLLLRMER